MPLPLMSDSNLRSGETVDASSPEKKSSPSSPPDSPPALYSDGPAELVGNTSQTSVLLTRRRSLAETITRVITGESTSVGVPKMGGGRDYPPLLNNRDPYKVEFDGPDDRLNPQNWPLSRKLTMVAVLGFSTFCTLWSSSVYAPAVPAVAEHFQVGEVTAVLGISLYVLGFASGPVLWGPLSEVVGRKIPIVLSAFSLTLCSFADATAKDFQTVMLCRFFGGFLGAAPLAVVAGAFSDMFNNHQRGTINVLYGGTIFCAPILAPVVGGFITSSKLGWRWTEYITGIMCSLACLLDILLCRETYHPIILAQKARQIRRLTGNWGVYAAHEDVKLDLKDLVSKRLVLPLYMLVTEPILILVTIYNGFIYGILYLCLEAYPLVFSEKYHFTGGIIELPYLGILVGMLCSVVVGIFVFEKKYRRAVTLNDGRPVPEARLPNMMVGSILFPIGIIWFAWSGNYPQHVHWIVPTISGVFTGYGLLAIFMCAINYIIDCYLKYAASAMAANTFFRSGFAAAFPLFATGMFHNLGVNWAGTLIGCIGIVLIPVPFFFHKYGKRIRQQSKYAFDL